MVKIAPTESKNAHEKYTVKTGFIQELCTWVRYTSSKEEPSYVLRARRKNEQLALVLQGLHQVVLFQGN